MGRLNSGELPKYLAFHKPNRTYYYMNPDMTRKANLGKDRVAAARIATTLNRRFSIAAERKASRLDTAFQLGGISFGSAFEVFVARYADSYRLKPSTRQRLSQRQ